MVEYCNENGFGRALLGLSAFLTVTTTGLAHAALTTEQWAPLDVPFTLASPPAAPFAVAFSATVVGPNGTYDVPGFYDGEGTWKVRVSASQPGTLSITAHAPSLPALDAQVATVTVSPNQNPNVHGALRVDPAHPLQLVYEDGVHPFLSAYECDWLWALGLAGGTTTAASSFLDKLSSYGFNQILLNAFAIDTSWEPGNTSPDDYGPPPRGAWGGTLSAPDYTTFDLLYWQHFDAVMEAMRTRGISTHLFFRVYNKDVVWPVNGSANDDAYFQWIVARYAAYPNVVWDFSKEAQHETDTPYKQGRLALIRQLDPYHRLTTVHDDQAVYASGAYAGLVDFRTDQTHANFHATVLSERSADHIPIMNAEYGYEWGPGGASDLTYPVGQSAETMLDWSWQIATAGAFGAYYYTYTAWDVLRPGDTPPGYAYYKNLTAFFGATNFWELLPNDAIVSAGTSGKGPLYALAKAGEQYVVYDPSGGPVVLTVAGATGSLAVAWFSIEAGVWVQSAPVTNGSVQLSPPGGLSGPLAVHVGAPAAPPVVDAGTLVDGAVGSDASEDAASSLHDSGTVLDGSTVADSSASLDAAAAVDGASADQGGTPSGSRKAACSMGAGRTPGNGLLARLFVMVATIATARRKRSRLRS